MNKNPENSESHKFKAVFTRDARTAWAKIISTAHQKHKKILLPSYIGYTNREGSGVFDPIQLNNSDYFFYKLNDDLSPDLTDLSEKITSADVDMVLIIHYFGFCRTDLKFIKNLCLLNDVLMIEDCAHAFYLSDNPLRIGETGNYSFYSIHKYLPTKTGGLLRVISEEISLPKIEAIESADIEVVEHFALANFSEIAQIRRANYKKYADLLTGVRELKILYDLRDYEIPQSFPVIIGYGRREELYFYLMNRKFPTTALYYQLIKEIGPREYPNSHAISRSILNLPVHQDVSFQDIDSLCMELKIFFRLKHDC
jgi:dTDP-4-amino-4,6-dideoxygalactose transaminase